MKASEKQELAKATEELNKEWNKSVFRHLRRIGDIAKPHIDDPRGVQIACDKYFEICEEDGMKPTVAGLSTALGTNRDTFMKWLSGEYRVATADILVSYMSLIEVFDETALKDNKTNAVAGIFNMKNNYNYKDEVEVKQVMDKKPTNKELLEKYQKRGEIIDVQPHEIEYKDGKKA